jgi:hypothetical protein
VESVQAVRDGRVEAVHGCCLCVRAGTEEKKQSVVVVD